MDKITFNNFLFSKIILLSFILKSILMALYTRTPASHLVLGLPYRTIDGVHQMDKDQRHSGALCLLKSMVPGMCGNTSGDPRPVACAPVWKNVFSRSPAPDASPLHEYRRPWRTMSMPRTAPCRTLRKRV